MFDELKVIGKKVWQMDRFWPLDTNQKQKFDWQIMDNSPSLTNFLTAKPSRYTVQQ